MHGLECMCVCACVCNSMSIYTLYVHDIYESVVKLGEFQFYFIKIVLSETFKAVLCLHMLVNGVK